jgi:quercetin dioxygenase-like cupin family protein
LKVNTNIFHAGDVVTIMPKEVHRLEAMEDAKIIEASTPELKDITRIQDDYGRV